MTNDDSLHVAGFKGHAGGRAGLAMAGRTLLRGGSYMYYSTIELVQVILPIACLREHSRHAMQCMLPSSSENPKHAALNGLKS